MKQKKQEDFISEQKNNILTYNRNQWKIYHIFHTVLVVTREKI